MGTAAIRERSDVSTETVFGTQFDSHGTIIIKCGFMEAEIITVRSFQSKGSMYGAGDVVNGSFLVVIFVTIGLIGGDFPGGGIGADVEFSEFVFDADLLKFGLRGNLVAKGNGIVEDAKSEGKDAVRLLGFGEIEG